MQCPKCRSFMEKVTYGGIGVDRCTDCGGMWFDVGEREKLKAKKGSERIDTGDPDRGEKLNKLGKINCPVCHTQMIRMVDLKQPHIWYESCTVCHGAFFDAGEFKDYKEKTIMDFFQSLMAPERE